jgi:hypothetical protein
MAFKIWLVQCSRRTTAQIVGATLLLMSTKWLVLLRFPASLVLLCSYKEQR